MYAPTFTFIWEWLSIEHIIINLVYEGKSCKLEYVVYKVYETFDQN